MLPKPTNHLWKVSRNKVITHHIPITMHGLYLANLKLSKWTITVPKSGVLRRGLPYMTSAQKGIIYDVRTDVDRVGSKNAPNLRTNSLDFADREGGRGSKLFWTSYMEASPPAYPSVCHETSTFSRLRSRSGQL